MRLKVKTLWNGQVGVRDKYVDKLRLNKEKLVILYQGNQMTVQFEDLEKKIKGKSEVPFKDRYSGNFHYLYYFDWKPDFQQAPLL